MRGLNLIIYGSEGIGKTSLALQFPKPVRCISIREGGYEDLDDIGEVPKDCENVSLDSFTDLISEIRQSTDVKTLIVDSLSGVSELVREDILANIYRTHDNPEQAFGSFSEGWRVHGPAWMGKLELACDAIRGKGVNIILVGHTKIEKGKNIISADYQSAMLDMESWPRSVLIKSAQAVLFMTMDFKLRITKTWKGKTTEAKVAGDLEDAVDRIMYTSKHPSHSAKNRLSLPTFIPMGESANEAYTNFKEACPQPIQEIL